MDRLFGTANFDNKISVKGNQYMLLLLHRMVAKKNKKSMVHVRIHYPIRQGVMGVYETDLSKTIRVQQLFAFIRNHININHLDDPHIIIERTTPMFYGENDKRTLYIKDDDVIHVLSETCRVTNDDDFDIDDTVDATDEDQDEDEDEDEDEDDEE